MYQGDHFEFGTNWSGFLKELNDERIAAAVASLQGTLAMDTLEGKRFLDVGSGSGLFSLAAHRLGARVVSFDYDKQSVACASQLKERFASGADWQILQGSALDEQFLQGLGGFDVVYAWGVLHHTGQMWTAIERVAASVMPEGLFCVAIYNDQQYISRAWQIIKRIYQRLPRAVRPIYAAMIGGVLFLKRAVVTLLASLLRLGTLRNPLVPIQNWLGERQTRGMHSWYNLVDWVGGWPFGVAKPEDVFRFLKGRGFTLLDFTTCGGGHGCNEFLFRRTVPPCQAAKW